MSPAIISTSSARLTSPPLAPPEISSVLLNFRSSLRTSGTSFTSSAFSCLAACFFARLTHTPARFQVHPTSGQCHAQSAAVVPRAGPTDEFGLPVGCARRMVEKRRDARPEPVPRSEDRYCMICCDLLLSFSLRQIESCGVRKWRTGHTFGERRASARNSATNHNPPFTPKLLCPLNPTPATMFSRPILRSLVRLASACLASAEMVVAWVFRLTFRFALHLRHSCPPLLVRDPVSSFCPSERPP